MPAKIEPQYFEAASLLAPGARVLRESQAIAVEDIRLVQIWHLQQQGSSCKSAEEEGICCRAIERKSLICRIHSSFSMKGPWSPDSGEA